MLYARIARYATAPKLCSSLAFIRAIRWALALALASATAGCCAPDPQHDETPAETCIRVADTMSSLPAMTTANAGYVDNRGPAPFGGPLPVGRTVSQDMATVVGTQLAEVRIRIVPLFHSSLHGMILPYFDLHRMDSISNIIVGRAWDPIGVPDSEDNDDPALAEAYSLAHDIVLPLTERVVDGARYKIVVGGENGGGEAGPIILCGTASDAE